jgi:hypothetical protein
MPATEHEKIKRSSDPSIKAKYIVVDPMEHPEWNSLLAGHSQAFIFHRTGWARVLQQTYGHTPVYICRFEGSQLVELPFTDFCAAQRPGDADGGALYEAAMDVGRQRRWKSLECRNFDGGWTGALPSLTFYGHVIDLAVGGEVLFQRLDGAVRRGIRKAGAAGLQVEFSTGLTSIRDFYALHCRTRRRHGLPPQPIRFFENIQRHVLDGGEGFVATARLKDQPLAAGVFFCQGRRVLYKYGASDYSSQEMRPNNLMMWEAIRQSAGKGFTTLHLGRTSLGNAGLRRFKMALGAIEENVRYSKYDFSSGRFVVDTDGVEGWFNRVFACLPLPLLRLAGRILYPHLA